MARAKRTDIHRPATINPEDYEYVSMYVFSNDPADEMANAENRVIFRSHLEKTGGKFASHEHGGTCHVCGSTAITLATYYHKPSNEYIQMGEKCHEKMFDDKNLFKNFKKGKERIQRKAIAKEILKDAGLIQALEISEMEDKSFSEDYPERRIQINRKDTIGNMVHTLINFGNLTEKQWIFLRNLVDQFNNHLSIEEKKKEDYEKALDCPEGKVEFEAEIVSVKIQESYYGSEIKALYLSKDGWKVYGTLPSKIKRENEYDKLSDLKGIKVKLSGEITRSDKDKKFGFIKRPTVKK